MKTRSFTVPGMLLGVVLGSVLLENGTEVATQFGKLVKTGKESLCVVNEATAGVVSIDAVDCSAETVTTPATPTGPSPDSSGN